MRWIVALFLGMLLAGCGTGSDVTVRVNGSPAQVIAPLTLASISEADALIPGLKMVKTRPSDRELLFTFPGDGKHEAATLLFTLTPSSDNEATEVHAEVSAPVITAQVKGVTRFLSAHKIAAEIRRTLEDMNKSGRDSATSRMSVVLMAMAISTDEAKLQKALAMADSPLGSLAETEGEERDYAENDPTEYEKPRDYSDPTRIDTPYEENDPTEYDAPDVGPDSE